jgi:ligand-binding sensor domain-containing protein/signal transduction histidine kinase
LRNHIAFLFISFYFTLNLSAQQAKQFSFKHLGSSSGLASNSSQQVVQDEQGFIWIATNNGLQRYDGIRFISFQKQKNNPSAIPNNYIHQLLLDKKNNLWILTGDGKAGVFDTKKFTYKEVPVRVKNPAILNIDRELVTDDDGNFFLFFHNNGFVTWNAAKNEFSEAYNFIPELSQWKIIGFIQQPGTKKYWIARREGMAIYDRQTGQLSYAGHNVAHEPFIEKMGNVVTPANIYFDHSNRAWFFSWMPGFSAIYCFDLAKKEPFLSEFGIQASSYYEIANFFQQKDGTVWVCGLNVFAQFNEQEKKFSMILNGYRNEQSIDYSRIYRLYEDREHNIWISTNNNGLYHFNPASQYFTNIRQINRRTNQPGDGSMMSFLQTKQGDLLAGAWDDGLYRLDNKYNPVPLGIKPFTDKFSPTAWSICYSTDSNTLWIGSQPGVHRVNTQTQTSVYYNPAIMGNRTVRQVAEDKMGNLWMGTQSLGLFKWTASQGKIKFDDGVTQFKDVPVNSQILKIYIDNRGYIWACTSGFGVYAIDPATNKVVLHFGMEEPAERKLISNGVASVIQYDDSTIVIAANGLHVFNINQQKIVKTIPIPESSTAIIAAMEKDRNGYLWLSMSEGIFRVSLKTGIFIHFDRVDGILNDHFVYAASYVLPDGRIIFGADNEFVVFDPLKVSINQAAPDVQFTGFKLMNKTLMVDSLLNKNRIKLSPEDNSIAIEFSGLTYDGTYIIKYKLEGLDKEWRRADNSSQAVYSYLPPRNYTFMVKSENAEGDPSKNITTLNIVVNPPFWKTWWFYSAVALLAALLLFRFDRERMKRKEAIQKMRTDIADNLHEKVSVALNNINILSEMARLKTDKDPQKSKEYIEQIHNKSQNMIIAMDDMIWSIDHENDSMEKTVERMKEYIAALKSRHGVSIDMLVDKKVESLQLNMKLRYESFLTFKEGIKNLVTIGATNLQIYIGLEKSKLLFNTQFDTEHSNLQELNNLLHRQDLEKRLEMMNAKISIQIHKTNSVISLQIPVS